VGVWVCESMFVNQSDGCGLSDESSSCAWGAHIQPESGSLISSVFCFVSPTGKETLRAKYACTIPCPPWRWCQ
jgi:hypothetical protein